MIKLEMKMIVPPEITEEKLKANVKSSVSIFSYDVMSKIDYVLLFINIMYSIMYDSEKNAILYFHLLF